MRNIYPKRIFSFFSAIIIFVMVFGFWSNIQYAQAATTPPTLEEAFKVPPESEYKTTDSCSNVTTYLSVSAFKCPFIGILQLNGWLLGASAALFGFVVDADKLQAVIANEALYTVWMEVRDFLNIAFILFLLYSAFSIIFQIGGKYGEKKIILTIVLMALLVNFSYPIARFIIDASNSLMYTLLNQFFPQSAQDPGSILTGITKGSAISTILSADTGASYPQLFAAIIFVFILAMTFLAMGVLLLIRVVALAILIITSPVAFVGNIAGKDFGWWDNLFKYAFFGPIMVFVLHIAVFTMQAMSDSASLASETNIVTTMANMAIPIVILWMGMGIAQKMGIAGASDVVGKAQGWATSAGKNLGGIRPLASWGFKKTGIPDAAQQKWDRFKEQGRLGSDAVKKRASDFGNIGPLSEKNHATKEMLRQADEYKKNLAQSTELKAKCAAGDAAACYRLAEDGDMDTSTYTTYSSAANVNTDQRDTINKKLKKNRLDILITNKLTDQKDVDARITKILDANPGMNISMAESTARVNIAAEEFGKLSAEQWNDQYWKDVLESNNPIIVAGAFTAFNNLDSLARAEINKRLNGNNRKALMDSGIL